MLRVIEPPLGRDAQERPSREEVARVWAEALKQPAPDYDGAVLAQFLYRRARRWA